MSSSAPILDTTRAGIIASQDYRDFIADLKARIQSARISAARAVNSELILLYWDIGHGILKKQQMLGWGDSVVELVAADLRREFPGATGFSAQNVLRMRQFYILHSQPEFLSQLVRGIKKSGHPVPSGEILSQAVRELVSAVPWGHHANALIRIEDPSARLWYLNRDCQENSVGNSPRKSNSPTSCARNSKIDANPPSQISPNPPPVTSHSGKAASVLRYQSSAIGGPAAFPISHFELTQT